MKYGKVFQPYRKFNGLFIPEWLAKRKEISLYAKCVYGRLMRYAGKRGWCYPSIDSIVKETAISRSQVIRAIKELLKHELIKVAKEHGKSNKYAFLWHPWIDENLGKTSAQQALGECPSDTTTSAQQAPKESH